MKRKTTKALAIVLVFIVMVSVLYACGGGNGGIKDGTYTADAVLTNQSWTFKGNKIIVSTGVGGMATTVECIYSYKDGVLSFWEAKAPKLVTSLDCDYDGDSITLYSLGRSMGGVKYTRQ